MKDVLKVPCSIHSSQTHPDDTNTSDDSAHPCVRADPRHDEIRRQIKDDIADVEQRQTGRHLLRRYVQYRTKIVLFVEIHRLRKTDIGSNG
jgi:hypothetical protein